MMVPRRGISLSVPQYRDYPTLVSMRRDRSIQADLGAEHFSSSVRDAYGWIRRALSDPRRRLFVIRPHRSRSAVGFLQVFRWEQGPIPLLGLAVHREHQGQGHGRAALESALEVVSAVGAKAVELHVLETNEKAIRLYTRVGFTESSRWIGQSFAGPVRFLGMMMQLPRSVSVSGRSHS